MPESTDTPNTSFLKPSVPIDLDMQIVDKQRPVGDRAQPTMSSREIADMVNARHDNVRRTIEMLAEKGVITLPQIEEKPTAGRPSLIYVFAGEKGKRDSIVVVAQLSPEFTARLVDRWQELEAKPAFNPSAMSRIDILTLAIESEQGRIAERSQRMALEQHIEEVAPKVAFAEQVAAAEDAITTGEAAKILGTGRTRLMEFLRRIGWVNRDNEPYQAKVEAGLMNLKITKWEHPRDGLCKRVTPLVTGKGLQRLHQLYQPVPA